MKEIIKTVMITAMAVACIFVFAVSGCGRQTSPAETPVNEEKTEQAATEAASQEVVGIANPWRDSTEEECRQAVANGFSAPEGATNVKWRIMDTDNEYWKLVEMDFDLDGMSFTARQQPTGDEKQDISGMYYDWTVEDEVTLANWAGGNMKATCKRYVGENEWADVCLWYDVETGDSYSLGTTAKDLEGFDIQAVAEAIYDPNKQVGANAPEESGELMTHERYVDIDGCDTFTQIVDKLPAGYGYANVTFGGTDALLVTDYTYDNLDGNIATIEAEVFTYTQSGTPQYAGFIEAGGTAYPLAIKDDKLYAGANHFMKVYTMSYGFPYLDDFVWVEYDTNGKGTYYYRSDLKDITEAGADAETGELKDDTLMNKLYGELFEGEIINFDVIK